METRHFHYIRTIYEAGSISRAAQQLYISQPSLSQLLKNIEKKVGAPLFDRSIQPLRPTTIGRKYLAAAKHIMEIDAEFRQYVEDELGCAQGNLIVAARHSAARISSRRSCLSSRHSIPVSVCNWPSIHRNAWRKPYSPVTSISSSPRSLSIPKHLPAPNSMPKR